jgi:hypothetical protein
MRSFTYAALFAGSAAASSSAVVLNLFLPNTTLISTGSENNVTTYINECAPDNAGVSVIPTETPTLTGMYASKDAPNTTTNLHVGFSSVASLRSSASSLRSAVSSAAGTLALTPIASPTPTAPARLRRQASGETPEGLLCEPYTIKQGASEWEYHLTDPLPGAWTLDAKCSWKGELTAATLTCTMTQSGEFAEEATGVSVLTLEPSELSSMAAIQTVSVITASGSSASGSVSGSGAAAQSTAMAPAGPLPTGAIAFVGGAAGMFAAVFAL